VLKYRSFKFRLYPNKTQESLLNQTFGAVRYLWNQNVETFNSYNEVTNPKPVYQTSTQIRHTNPWMLNVSSAAVQQKEKDFKECLKQHFNKSRKKLLGKPKFKTKRLHNSFRLPFPKFKIYDNKIYLEKIGRVKIVLDRELHLYKLLSVTVSKNSSGQYWASILIETEINHLPKTGKTVGIDMGLTTFLTRSDNQIIENPRYFRESQSKIKKLQRRLSKKVKGSKRYEKCRLKLAKAHQKIVNQRDYFLHNITTNLVRELDSIYIEDLNVVDMIKNHKLAKSIGDASFSKFFSMLSYKAHWYGKTVLKVDRFYPSSKTCSGCRHKKDDLKLSERTYCCDNCGLEIDRDLNAAINIHSMGIDMELNRT
jgi:putative transposase